MIKMGFKLFNNQQFLRVHLKKTLRKWFMQENPAMMLKAVRRMHRRCRLLHSGVERDQIVSNLSKSKRKAWRKAIIEVEVCRSDLRTFSIRILLRSLQRTERVVTQYLLKILKETPWLLRRKQMKLPCKRRRLAAQADQKERKHLKPVRLMTK